jgi:hypothetical protein
MFFKIPNVLPEELTDSRENVRWTDELVSTRKMSRHWRDSERKSASGLGWLSLSE